LKAAAAPMRVAHRGFATLAAAVAMLFCQPLLPVFGNVSAMANGASSFADNRAQPRLRTTPLEIVTPSGRFTFRAEVARTEAEQARGLMFRPRQADAVRSGPRMRGYLVNALRKP